MARVVHDDEIMSNEQADELLKANAHFANHLYSFITPMSLKCALELAIFDTIEDQGGSVTLQDLAQALPVHPKKMQFIPQLLRVLTHAGYFEKTEVAGGGVGPAYSLTPVSRLLLTHHPFTAKPYVLFAIGRFFMQSWMGLSRWYQSGSDPTPFHTAHGMSLWECTRIEGGLSENINEAMAGDSRMVASVLVAKGGAFFGGVGSLVDVGGGTGGLARAISAAYPETDCTVLDLPQVVEGAQGGPNLRFVAGDMFHHVPPADLVMLKWLLHDWDDEDSVKILKQCRKAITSERGKKGHGKVIIIDIVIKDEDDVDYDSKLGQTQLFYDMQMMGILAGKERTEKEWKKIFDDAGFAAGYKIYPVLGFRSVIEVYP